MNTTDLIFYDPKDNRVKAVYSHGTNSKEWEKRGYIGAEVPKKWGASQNHLVKLKDKKVVGVIHDPLPLPVIPPHPLEGKLFSELSVKEKDSLLLELLSNTNVLDEDGKVK